MGLIKHVKKKTGFAALFFALSFFALLGFKLWEDQTDKREDAHVDQLLAKPPLQLNSQAVKKITAVTAGRDHFRFAVLGDNRYNLKQLKKILQAIAQDKPDFVIHTGDMTSGGKYQQYLQLLDIIRDFKIPMVFILGNHDINFRGIDCFLNLFGPVSFYFDINKYRFIFIDNTPESAKPEFFRLPEDAALGNRVEVGLDDYQLREVEKLIQQSARNFIILHIPPPLELFRFHCFYKNGDNFISLLQHYAARIALVFSGHIHGYSEAASGGVRYIVTGGAGASLVKLKKDVVGKFNYVLVNVAGNTITHTVQYVD